MMAPVSENCRNKMTLGSIGNKNWHDTRLTSRILISPIRPKTGNMVVRMNAQPRREI
ncbi:hypothetical protein PI125_g22513 [Phytophthora idaei]|nr:hypothetical protein PI125_g22513 [Phytophthora idaei]